MNNAPKLSNDWQANLAGVTGQVFKTLAGQGVKFAAIAVAAALTTASLAKVPQYSAQLRNVNDWGSAATTEVAPAAAAPSLPPQVALAEPTRSFKLVSKQDPKLTPSS